MKTWIVLLRGINVGGNNILPMKELRALLTDLGHESVRTYIQSGNCVFKSNESDTDRLADRIGGEIENRFGFRPHIFALALDALDAAIANNPYPQGHDDPKSVHLFFLSEPATDADLEALQALRKDSEAFALKEDVFYLYTPDGIGRSKLAEKIKRHVPVPMTARNLRSALKIAELARTV